MTTPKTYRKKPVEIKAMQFPTDGSGVNEILAVTGWLNREGHPWIGEDDSADRGIYIDPESRKLVIRTLEGDMRVKPGAWIIRGVQGEMYACAPDIFEQTYEAIA